VPLASRLCAAAIPVLGIVVAENRLRKGYFVATRVVQRRSKSEIEAFFRWIGAFDVFSNAVSRRKGKEMWKRSNGR